MRERIRIAIHGAVQGVGFRPFLYRLATEMQLPGWVVNSGQGVFVEVEGTKDVLDSFLLRIEREKPPRSSIHSLEFSLLDPVGFESFEIRESSTSGEKSALVLPDIASCSDCLAEIFDPKNRRYLYPFTNCTNCGPRFTIIESLPYDRPNTTMKDFQMCDECRREYENPLDRRFHAQPNACPWCGPSLELWDAQGQILCTHQEALLSAAEAIRHGKIVAVKGLGGFHLMVDARNDKAVVRLRQRKRREEKPLALMYPSLSDVTIDCKVSELEQRLLLSPESPIVLLSRHLVDGKAECEVAPSVAPRNPYFGVLLPYTPLHYILMRELGFPIVATSGNISDEPICTEEREALERLGAVADVFLVHNRPIVRHVDDSIVTVMMGRELVLRRARGYAPLPIRLKRKMPHALAVGGHLKNTIALTVGDAVFLSQHIGDLETNEAFQAFQKVIRSFLSLYGAEPEYVVRDLHPDYLSSQYSRDLHSSVLPVQHHYAHVASCMAENELEGSVLGVSWDGTGYGLDQTIWGGEFLLTDEISFERIASFRTFPLPGGTKAIAEPRRTALGLLYEIFGENLFNWQKLEPLRSFAESELVVLRKVLARKMNSPLTSSVGRLFDAVASIVGLCQRIHFEGQAAMELEFAAGGVQTNERYAFCTAESAGLFSLDWEPMVVEILDDVYRGVSHNKVAAKFHNTLVEMILGVAKRTGQERVVLTGGCFQNRYLTERTVRRLEAEGFRPYWHQRVPPNDGGIALGQIFAAARLQKQMKDPAAGTLEALRK